MAAVTVAVMNGNLCVRATGSAGGSSGMFVYKIDTDAALGERIARLLKGEHPANLGFKEVPNPQWVYPKINGISAENFPL